MRRLDIGSGSVPDLKATDLLDVEDPNLEDVKLQGPEFVEAFQRARFVKGRAEKLPFPSRTFKEVVSRQAITLSNIDTARAEEAIPEILRVLMLGGVAKLTIILDDKSEKEDLRRIIRESGGLAIRIQKGFNFEDDENLEYDIVFRRG